MKIIIAGGGVAGLSTYLHLRKHLPSPQSHTIHIFESHRPRSSLPSPSSGLSSHINLDMLSESTAIVGGGLGIAPNGMRVLRNLDMKLHDAVKAQGAPAEKFIFRGQNGWTLGVQSTSDRRVRGEGEEEVCVASSRHGLWGCLIRAVVSAGGIIEYKRVVGVERDGDTGRVKVKVVDEKGNEAVEEADLLVGADGVKSTVRGFLLGDDERFKPEYTGLSGVGGFLKTPIPDSVAQTKAMVFTFGRNGFFGYSTAAPLTSQSLMWWSTFETSSLPDTKNINTAAIKAELWVRHQHWADPVIQSIVSKAEVESIYPTWVLPELPHWGEQGIVLVGDAAHALDPTTGQGASQALEDSLTLSLLLSHLLASSSSRPSSLNASAPALPSITSRASTDNPRLPSPTAQSINRAISLLHKLRAPRIHAILERGKKLSSRKAKLNVVQEYAMYFFFWMMMKVPALGRVLIGDVEGELYGWDAGVEVRRVLGKKDGVLVE